MERYINVNDITLKGVAVFDENLDLLIPLSDVRKALQLAPTADVVPRGEVAREIEEFEKKVGKIYNHYVFEDTDYSDDDVAVEAAMNALTDVLNDLAELKKKYTEGKE